LKYPSGKLTFEIPVWQRRGLHARPIRGGISKVNFPRFSRKPGPKVDNWLQKRKPYLEGHAELDGRGDLGQAVVPHRYRRQRREPWCAVWGVGFGVWVNVQRFRGGLVFKAHRLLVFKAHRLLVFKAPRLVYHSTLGWRVTCGCVVPHRYRRERREAWRRRSCRRSATPALATTLILYLLSALSGHELPFESEIGAIYDTIWGLG